MNYVVTKQGRQFIIADIKETIKYYFHSCKLLKGLCRKTICFRCLTICCKNETI